MTKVTPTLALLVLVGHNRNSQLTGMWDTSTVDMSDTPSTRAYLYQALSDNLHGVNVSRLQVLIDMHLEHLAVNSFCLGPSTGSMQYSRKW